MMTKHFGVFVLALLSVGILSANAQNPHEFLGPPREVPDEFTVKHGIRYNTNGYDEPKVNWEKKFKKWAKKEIPQPIINEIMAFPGSPDAIGQWIDAAFDNTRAQFSACGGALADRAARVSAREVSVTIMSSAFYEPHFDVLVAGAYYPAPKKIKVLNIYYIWKGEYKGWLVNNFFVACQPHLSS